MTSISILPPAAALVTAGVWIVGATFLWAGVLKAVAPHVFEAHLFKLGWIPHRYVGTSVTAAAALETGWGIALILGITPGLILPATALALVGLTIVTWWGVRSGRTTDCGCYGGYLVPSLAQSIALNATFVALTLIAWATQDGTGPTPIWKLLAAAAAAIVSGGFARTSLRFLQKHGRFMVRMSPLKVGRSWRARWGANIADDGTEQIVSYLGPDCPHCKQWVRVLNAIDQSPGLPQVVGIVAATNEKLETFVESSGIRFPMKIIPQTLLSRLVWGIPTTVLVSEGKIQNQWSGQMPPEFFQRFRDAFFPSSGAATTGNGTEAVVGGGATRST